MTFHASGDFLRQVFKKSEKNLRRAMFLKGKFNKMEIEMNSETEIQLKESDTSTIVKPRRITVRKSKETSLPV